MHKNLIPKFKIKIMKILEEKKTIPKVNWKSIFDLFDSDKDGKLNLDEAKKYLAVVLDKDIEEIKTSDLKGQITSEDDETNNYIGTLNLLNVTKKDFIKSAAVFNKDKEIDLDKLIEKLKEDKIELEKKEETKAASTSTTASASTSTSKSPSTSSKKTSVSRPRYRYQRRNIQGGGISLTILLVITFFILLFVFLKRTKYI